MTLELRNRGFVVNHKKAQRLMKVLGLTARIRRKRKYSSYQGDVGKKADNLIQRQFEATKLMQKCYTDVTKFAIPASRLKLYLSPVLDGFNSEIISYQEMDDLDTAYELYQELAGDLKDNPEFLEHYIYLLRELGYFEEAKVNAQAYLKLVPDDVQMQELFERL
jgi:tetratricopeptide (TPR) repeat protein